MATLIVMGGYEWEGVTLIVIGLSTAGGVTLRGVFTERHILP